MEPSNDTLTDRLLRRLKNNPVIAGIIVAAIAISGIAAFWQGLPSTWRERLTPDSEPAETGPQNGWIFAGYLDGQTGRLWASPPNVRVVRPSGAPDRQYPIRVGDVVTPTSPRPQVIVDFLSAGSEHVLTPPVQLREVILKAQDYTGRTLRPGELFEVAHIDVSGLPDSDLSVWLRLIPHTPPQTE